MSRGTIASRVEVWWWRAPHVVWLSGLWAVLWGDASPAVVVSGAGIGVAVLATRPRRSPLTHTVRVLPGLRFVGTVVVDIVRANVAVAVEVLTPADRTNPGVVEVTLPTDDPAVVTATTQAVNLAPGTVVVDQPAPSVLHVHALHLHDAADVVGHVQRLARLADAALVPHRRRSDEVGP